MIVLAYFAYLISMLLAFSLVPSYLVIDSSLLVVYVAFGAFITSVSFWLSADLFPKKDKASVAIAVLHIYLALLVGLSIGTDGPYYRDNDQVQALRSIHKERDSRVAMEIAGDLSKTIHRDVIRYFHIEHPILGLLYPPSICLTFWGVVIFLSFPNRGE